MGMLKNVVLLLLSYNMYNLNFDLRNIILNYQNISLQQTDEQHTGYISEHCEDVS